MAIPQIIPIPSRKPTDPWVVGRRAGWKITDGSQITAAKTEVTFDVAIIGTGAGGGITAEMLAAVGLKVVMIEEGPLKSSTDFNMKESDAYPQMYQENLGRRTLDGGVGIMQGRTVGGGTVVNWATSFRTPDNVLKHWQSVYGLTDLTTEKLAPWFAAVEKRLGIKKWSGAQNANNAVLSRGLTQMGLTWNTISPNVRACANLGYCGLGCPINAKQSMLVTTIPTAMARGAQLYTRMRAQNFTFNAGKTLVTSLVCHPLDASGLVRNGTKEVIIKAKHYVLAASAINGPALLLRSGAPDPHGRLGKRTFLHASASVGAVHPGPIKAWEGLPQSVYSDAYLDDKPLTGELGWKLEVAPINPVLVAISASMHGEDHTNLMRSYPNYSSVISFMRDGFNDVESPSGTVKLRADGSPGVDYPLTPGYFSAIKKAIRSQGAVQFAAGASRVFIGHLDADPQGYTTQAAFNAALDGLTFTTGRVRLNSAHQMGGCGMAREATQGVTNQDGRHHQLGNLSVHDSSLFPTGLGLNPQETIFALAARNTAKLALDIFAKKDCKLVEVAE
jgi:choline dehydrogenase-like flavoprotein